MRKSIVVCDRCGKHIDEIPKGVFTCEYYEVAIGYWSKFANKGEAQICDSCMFKDPRYIEVYGHRS